MTMRNRIWFCLAVSVFSFNLSAQEISYPDSFKEPIPQYTEILGDLHFPISSSNRDAQIYFDQGFQLMYAFTKVDAARSFRAAQQADPDCAICFWGEAWTWGSYLNGAMTSADAPRAFSARTP